MQENRRQSDSNETTKTNSDSLIRRGARGKLQSVSPGAECGKRTAVKAAKQNNSSGACAGRAGQVVGNRNTTHGCEAQGKSEKGDKKKKEARSKKQEARRKKKEERRKNKHLARGEGRGNNGVGVMSWIGRCWGTHACVCVCLNKRKKKKKREKEEEERQQSGGVWGWSAV